MGAYTFMCRTHEEDGRTIYTACDGKRVAFPGVIKVVAGEEILWELLAVEGR